LFSLVFYNKATTYSNVHGKVRYYDYSTFLFGKISYSLLLLSSRIITKSLVIGIYQPSCDSRKINTIGGSLNDSVLIIWHWIFKKTNSNIQLVKTTMELQLPANMKFMGSHGSRIETSWRLTSRRDGIFFKKTFFLYSAAAIAQAHNYS